MTFSKNEVCGFMQVNKPSIHPLRRGGVKTSKKDDHHQLRCSVVPRSQSES